MTDQPGDEGPGRRAGTTPGRKPAAPGTGALLVGVAVAAAALLAPASPGVLLSGAAPFAVSPVAGVLHAVPARAQEPDHTVVLTDIEFSPEELEVSVGDTVRFVNQDDFEHDVYLVRTANRNDVLVEPTTIPAGDSVTVTVDQAGLYTLYCTIHGGMRGKVTTTGTFELTEEEKARAAARDVVPPLARDGEELFWGVAQCHQCHRVDDRGDALRGPDLVDIGFRSAARAQRLGLDNGTEYIVQSIQEPSSHIVEGYTDDMATVYQPPVDLGQEELTAVVAYLQSQGGEVDDWLIDFDPDVLDREPPDNPYADADPSSGEQVFEKMRCYSCHQVDDREPISVGPELTEIGAYRDWQWLEESLVDPNAEIGANWKRARVTLTSGEDVTGTLRENSTEQVVLLTQHEQSRTIPADEVERVEVLDTTMMPENYPDLMTEQELADLIAYLQSLKGQWGSQQ